MVKVKAVVLLAGAVLAVGLGGCSPYTLGLATPIPVFPWVTERMEEKYCHKNDHRTPIMPPIRPGYPPPACEDPPDQSMILRAMPHVARGIPYVFEEFRDDIQIVAEKLVDRIDPPRFFPLVGPAQLHHCHWKATIYYTETIESGYPFPFRCRRPRIEVVLIDKDHLHLYVCENEDATLQFTRDVAP